MVLWGRSSSKCLVGHLKIHPHVWKSPCTIISSSKTICCNVPVKSNPCWHYNERLIQSKSAFVLNHLGHFYCCYIRRTTSGLKSETVTWFSKLSVEAMLHCFTYPDYAKDQRDPVFGKTTLKIYYCSICKCSRQKKPLVALWKAIQSP